MSPSFEWMSAQDAVHLARALKFYRKYMHKQGAAVPASFAAYEAELSERAVNRQEPPSLDARPRAMNSGPVPLPCLLTIGETGHAMHLSTRTVERRIADGSIPAVKIGRLTRVRREEITAYINRLGGVA